MTHNMDYENKIISKMPKGGNMENPKFKLRQVVTFDGSWCRWKIIDLFFSGGSYVYVLKNDFGYKAKVNEVKMRKV